MQDLFLKKLQMLYIRFKKIEQIFRHITILSNNSVMSSLSKEYAKLSDIIQYYVEWKKLKKNIKLTKLLLYDADILDLVQDELTVLQEKNMILERKIKQIVLPEDPDDKKSCFIEIRAATGGDEAAIFAGDLFKMYGKYAEYQNWNIKIMSCSIGEKGGFKEIILKITGLGVCGRLKFESGGHRVQRVPQTESQGRIHTSTCTVAVMPEVLACEDTIIKSSDLKIDTFRSSGAGGQHVNTTDSAIRITHIPTGTVVECQDERSQHKNKSKALSILSARIHAQEIKKKKIKDSFIRKNLLGTGDRSDRNRTYNFPKNRVTDHRINLTIYCLQDILNGNLDMLIEPILQEYYSDLLLYCR
ncbi:Peptide chain release factor RF1 [Buchnera aphidicola (Pterocallis alni)]|uniref:peptide chain release factor 1 n=1 Tax=Buchnera aphidicola TaxID=9 RepID=UPI003464D889